MRDFRIKAAGRETAYRVDCLRTYRVECGQGTLGHLDMTERYYLARPYGKGSKFREFEDLQQAIDYLNRGYGYSGLGGKID